MRHRAPNQNQKRSALVLCAFTLWIGSVCPANARAQSPQELLFQANQALVDQDYPTAVKALEAYLKLYPDDYRAQFNLALVFSMTDRKPEAIALYRQVLAEANTLTPAHVNLGILLLESGEAAEAAEHLQAAVDQQPEHWEANVQLAHALTLLKRLPDARAAYERAILMKPEDSATHFDLAKLLAEADPRAAERHVRSALRLSPELFDAQLLLASLLEARVATEPGVLPELAETYRKYLEGHPERVDLRLHLGDLYYTLKRFPEAVEELQKARAESVRLTTEQASDATTLLLRSYLEMKENEKVLALLPDVLAKEPENTEWLLLLGSLRMEKKQYADAAGSFQRVVQLDPESVDGYRNLASALYLLKNYAGTVAALDRVGTLGKDTAGTFFLRAITLDQLGQQLPALQNYQRFLDTSDKKAPDQEFQARQRVRILTIDLERKGVRVR